MDGNRAGGVGRGVGRAVRIVTGWWGDKLNRVVFEGFISPCLDGQESAAHLAHQS